MLGPFDLLTPPLVLLSSILTLPFTLLIHLVSAPTSLSWPTFRHQWFNHLWFWFGPASKPIFAPSVRPLLAQAKGVVLDIGPASGIWMPEFGRLVKEHPGQITKIWGVEPNKNFHGQLRAGAKKAGLEGIYEPVAAYAEELETKVEVKKGSVDTIITVHVLCSVGPRARQERIVNDLYEYLKPGGQWLAYEHVASHNPVLKAWQGKSQLQRIHLGHTTGTDGRRYRSEQPPVAYPSGWLRHPAQHRGCD